MLTKHRQLVTSCMLAQIHTIRASRMQFFVCSFSYAATVTRPAYCIQGSSLQHLRGQLEIGYGAVTDAGPYEAVLEYFGGLWKIITRVSAPS